MSEQITATTIQNNFDAHTGESGNWSTRIDFDPVDRVVKIYDFFGNGQSMATFNGTERSLGGCSHANIANIGDLVELLEGEEAQELLNDIAEGFETYWDGSNHRGRLTEDAAFAEEKLGEMIEDWFSSSATSYYTASEWFSGTDIVEEMLRGDHDVESYVAEQEAKAEAGQIDEDDIRSYVENELEKAVDSEDLVEANFARHLLDKPEVTTLWREWERYDENQPDGVEFDQYNLDGKSVILVDDKCQCWLVEEVFFDAAMDEVREVPADLGEDRRRWWYDVLCGECPHNADFVEAFEAEYGGRNWAR